MLPYNLKAVGAMPLGLRPTYGPIAQLVEHLPFKQGVDGSNPSGLTILLQRFGRMRPHRLAWPRTPAFHAGDRGSNPLGDANYPE